MFAWMDTDKGGVLSADEIINSIQQIIDKYDPPVQDKKNITGLA